MSSPGCDTELPVIIDKRTTARFSLSALVTIVVISSSSSVWLYGMGADLSRQRESIQRIEKTLEEVEHQLARNGGMADLHEKRLDRLEQTQAAIESRLKDLEKRK